MSVNGERLELRPGSRVPADLHEAIRQHKADLLDRLAPRTPGDDELTDIAQLVSDHGYALLWSHVLVDFVAFVRSDAERENVPPGFTIYVLDELMELFEGETVWGPDHQLAVRTAGGVAGRAYRRCRVAVATLSTANCGMRVARWYSEAIPA